MKTPHELEIAVIEAEKLIDPMQSLLEFILLVTPAMPADRRNTFEKLIESCKQWREKHSSAAWA